MNKTIIGQFYKELKSAQARVKFLEKMWRGRVPFFIIKTQEGYMIISEGQARACNLIK